MLDLRKINHKYNDQYILKDINLHFNDVGFYGIIGESGSGKSTLLNIISGIVYPTSGNVYYNNICLTNLSTKQYAEYRKQDIAYIYQNENLFNDFTMLENVKLAMIAANIEFDEDLFYKWATELEIADLINEKIKVMSGGEKQRIAILITILKDAKVILADEITSNLDPETAEKVFLIFKELAKSKLIIFVSHDHKKIYQYCDYIINIDEKTNVNDINHINQTINLDKTKKNYKNINKFNKQYNSRNYFYSILFMIINLFLVSSSLIFNYIGNFNYQNKVESYLNENNENLIVNYDFDLNNKSFDFRYETLIEKFPQFSNFDYVYLENTYLSDFIGYNSSFVSNYFDDDAFKYIVITDEYNGEKLNNMDIIITDYTKTLFSLTNIISEDDLICTKKHKLWGYTYNLKYNLKIKQTDFFDFYNNENYFNNNKDLYYQKQEFEYKKCYMNFYTYYQFYPYLSRYTNNLTINGYQIATNSTLNDNEVILSYDLGPEFANGLNFKYANINKNYEVKNVLDNDIFYNTIFVSNNEYYRLAIEYVIERNDDLFALQIYDNITFKNAKKLSNENYLILNINYYEVTNLLIYSSNLFIYKIVYFIILFIFLFFNIIYNLLYVNKRKDDYRILNIYGCNNDFIQKANFIYFANRFVISFIISNIIYLLFKPNLIYILTNLLQIKISNNLFDLFMLFNDFLIIFIFVFSYAIINKKVGVKYDSSIKHQ